MTEEERIRLISRGNVECGACAFYYYQDNPDFAPESKCIFHPTPVNKEPDEYCGQWREAP